MLKIHSDIQHPQFYDFITVENVSDSGRLHVLCSNGKKDNVDLSHEHIRLKYLTKEEKSFIKELHRLTPIPSPLTDMHWLILSRDIGETYPGRYESTHEQYVIAFKKILSEFSADTAQATYENPNSTDGEVFYYARFIEQGGTVEQANQHSYDGVFLYQAMTGSDELIAPTFSMDNGGINLIDQDGEIITDGLLPSDDWDITM